MPKRDAAPAHDRHRLPRRAGPAHPRRAHRHRRQQEDQGLRYPPRVPDRRGRPRQRLPDRARAQARAGAGLLQERRRPRTGPARRRTRWSSPSRWSRTSPTTCPSASATRWPEGVIGDISLTERNFLGNGQWLRLKLAGSLTRLQAEIGFTEPRFLGTNLAAGFDLFYKDVDYTNQASYKSQKIGGTSARRAIPSTSEWSAGVNYTFVRNKLYDVGADASAAIKEAVPGFPDATSNTYYTSSVGYSLTYDTRDNKKRPTSGVYYTVAQDLAGRRRRRALHPLGRRGARLLRRERGRDRHGPRHRRHHHGLGRPGRAPARSLLSRRRDGARLCHRGHRPPRHPERQPGRAGRAHVLRHDRGAAVRRFPACRRTSACAAPCSPMPARCGASTAQRQRCRASPATRRRCAPRSAWGSPGTRRSATCASTTPSPSLKQPYDKTQALSFGLRPF